MELCSSFRVIFGLFVASLINALLAWSMSFGGWPSLGRIVVVPYSFHFLIMDLIVLCSKFQIFFYNPSLICTSPQLCPWPVWREPWSSWFSLLGGVPCLVVLQTLGPFITFVYIYWGHVTLRLHTVWLYLTHYVTSEDNWLHQILFRDVAKGVRGWIHMHAMLSFFNFLFHLFELLCPIHELQIKIHLN